MCIILSKPKRTYELCCSPYFCGSAEREYVITPSLENITATKATQYYGPSKSVKNQILKKKLLDAPSLSFAILFYG